MKWIKNLFGTIFAGIGIVLAGVSVLPLAALVGTLIIIASPILAIVFCYEDEREDNTDGE